MQKFVRFTYVFEDENGNEVFLEACIKQDLIKAVVQVSSQYSKVALLEGSEPFTVTNAEAEKIMCILNKTD